ncbi:uncharacterized protein LOC132543730 [Ylistrum balloti]|uniref:uncharacterized protein LOC132543730 n=1 Tax=Ylistrum balloti TaxID=509963 RepID=UPI002905CD45|nr:uncharacterized protein LOC132543730 [Ylistrum balloti]
MDEETVDWVMSDNSVDTLSGVPLSAVVFLLYYGFELQHFLLQISDLLLTRYPLKLYDVGRSSVYLGGSCAHGFFLNSNRLTELRDFDIVTILKKYDIKTQCEYDKAENTEFFSGQEPVKERNNDFCPSDNRINVTCGEDTSYLNVEPSDQAGYVLLRKCRPRSISQVSLQQRYVSSSAIMNARFEYWHDAKSLIKQRYTGTSFLQNLFDDSGYGPVLSFVQTLGPAVTAFLTDRRGPMTTTLHTDIVIALPYPGWPAQAREWLSRDNKYGWPSEAMKREIQNDVGCMIVPIGHYGSDMEDFQWRISFSRAEMMLSRSFTRVQRELVHLLKAFDIGGSYHMLNLVYRLIENTPGERWRSKDLASQLFTVVDQYITCICEHRLSHYFLPIMNLLSKFEQDFVEVNGRRRPINEHIETVLIPLYELRINPLDTILKQSRHLSLCQGIRQRVFAPLVNEMKSSGPRSKVIFVDTLVALAKGHLHNRNLPLAYKYVQDAVKFSHRVKLELSEEKLMDLHLTAAVCGYLSGDTDSALVSLQLLEQYLGTDKQGFQSVVDKRRSYYLLLYGRVLFIRAFLTPDQNSTAVANTREMYRRAMDTLVPDTSVYLDSLNFFMRLGESDEVSKLISFLSAYLLPNGVCDDVQEYTPKYGRDEREHPVGTNIDEAVVTEINTQGPNNIEDEEDIPQSSTLELSEDMSDSPVDTASRDGPVERDSSVDTDQDGHIEVIYDRDRHVREETTSSWTPMNDESPKSTSIAGEGDFQLDPESDTFPEEIRNLDYYFIERINLAKRYAKVGMDDKANEMFGKVKEKLKMEHDNADHIFSLALEASESFEESNRFYDSTPEDWDDIMKDSTGYLTYCDTDLPIVDDIMAALIRRKAGTVKVTHKEALLHFRIQHFKLLHDFDRAESIVSDLECICGNSIRDECRWLVKLHKAYFGRQTKDDDDDDLNDKPNRDLRVLEEVITRIDQLMDMIKAHEIRNSAMDDIFNFSDY